MLTPDEEEFLRSIRRDYEKSSALRASAAVTVLLGIGIGISPFVLDTDDNLLFIGIFFASLGLLTLRDIFRTKRLYEILKKFLPSNMELPR